jgi:hypothetical protein
MSTDDYKGFTNKPTWILSAWIHKKEESYSHWLKQARSVTEKKLSDELKQHYGQDRVPLINAKDTLYRDLFEYALEIINWDEISRLLINEAKK